MGTGQIQLRERYSCTLEQQGESAYGTMLYHPALDEQLEQRMVHGTAGGKPMYIQRAVLNNNCDPEMNADGVCKETRPTYH